MSAGTVSAMDSSSYVGGFAGQYSGTLAGLEKDIELKNCYGNCQAEDGKILKAIGNMSSSTVEAIQQVLNEMQLETEKDVADKLWEMFGVKLVSSTEEEQKEILQQIYGAISADVKNNDLTPWIISDIVAYETAYGIETSLSEETIQNYINYVAEKGALIKAAREIWPSISFL